MLQVRSKRRIVRDGARSTDGKQQAPGAQVAAPCRTVAQDLAALSDEELITTAGTTLSQPYNEMEMQRRLKVAIEGLTDESVRARRSAFWIGVILVALTVALVALTVVLAVRN